MPIAIVLAGQLTIGIFFFGGGGGGRGSGVFALFISYL